MLQTANSGPFQEELPTRSTLRRTLLVTDRQVASQASITTQEPGCLTCVIQIVLPLALLEAQHSIPIFGLDKIASYHGFGEGIARLSVDVSSSAWFGELFPPWS